MTPTPENPGRAACGPFFVDSSKAGQQGRRYVNLRRALGLGGEVDFCREEICQRTANIQRVLASNPILPMIDKYLILF
jgi:hypothetical protein